MLIVMKTTATEAQVEAVVGAIERNGFTAHVSRGDIHTVIGAVGGKSMDFREIELIDGVEKLIKISSSYKLCSRMFQTEDTVIDVNGVKFGGEHAGVIAGPCTVESEEQMDAVAKKLLIVKIRTSS